MASIFRRDKVEVVENGTFPSTNTAYGVENNEATPIRLSDKMPLNPCEAESRTAHLRECVSGTTICEIECMHLEGVNDTLQELRG